MVNLDLYYPVILQAKETGYQELHEKLVNLARGYSHLCLDDGQYEETACREAENIVDYIINNNNGLNQRMFCVVLDEKTLSSLGNEGIKFTLTRLVRPFLRNLNRNLQQLFSIYLVVGNYSRNEINLDKITELIEELNIRNPLIKNVVFWDERKDYLSAICTHIFTYACRGFDRLAWKDGNTGYNIIIGQELKQELLTRVNLHYQSVILRKQIGGADVTNTYVQISENQYCKEFEQLFYYSQIDKSLNENDINCNEKNILTAISYLTEQDESLFGAVPISMSLLNYFNEAIFITCYKSLFDLTLDKFSFTESIEKARKAYSIADFKQHYFKTCRQIVENLKPSLRQEEKNVQGKMNMQFTNYNEFWKNYLSKKCRAALLRKVILALENEIKNSIEIESEVDKIQHKKRSEIERLERDANCQVNSVFYMNFRTELDINVKNWGEDSRQILEKYKRRISTEFLRFQQSRSDSYHTLLRESIQSIQRSFERRLDIYRRGFDAIEDVSRITITGISDQINECYYLRGLPSDYLALIIEEKHNEIADIYRYSEEEFEI